MDKNSKIYIAGDSGLVGSSLTRTLKSNGYYKIITTPHKQYDLRNQAMVEDFFSKEKPEYVFICAAKVGGIHDNNSHKADFIYDNMMIEFNIIHFAYKYHVKKLLFLGSSCIYPKNSPIPIREEYLLTGELEKTNEAYALAKISGLKMCDYYREQYNCDFISAMPTNLFGPNDNYDLAYSHVLPALIRKFYLAKALETGDWQFISEDLASKSIGGIFYNNIKHHEIIEILDKHGISKDQNKNQIVLSLWGSGKPLREFLHVDHLSEVLVFLMQEYSDYGHVNVGTGVDIRIKDLAELIKSVIGFNGKILWDNTKPDGTMKKTLSIEKLSSLGWEKTFSFKYAIIKTIKDYLLLYAKN